MNDMHALLCIALLAGCFFAALRVVNKITDRQLGKLKSKQWELWKEKHVTGKVL